MANTLYRVPDGLPVFHTERVIGRNHEMVRDAAGHAHYVIVGNEHVYDRDGQMAFWISGNYLIGPNGPACYFTPLLREDELADYLKTRGADGETIKRWRWVFGCNLTEAQSIIAALGD